MLMRFLQRERKRCSRRGSKCYKTHFPITRSVSDGFFPFRMNYSPYFPIEAAGASYKKTWTAVWKLQTYCYFLYSNKLSSIVKLVFCQSLSNRMHTSSLQSLIVNVLHGIRKYLPVTALWKFIPGNEILYQEHHEKLVSSVFFWNSLKNKSSI